MSAISKDKLVFDTTATLEDNDNIGAFLRSADGTLLTHTTVGGKEALDVNVANTVDVQATDLDIRDLDATQDNVAISDGTDTLAINADGSINSVVTATDLDIRDLDHAQDNVSIAQGGNTMIVNADGSINVNADISVVNGSDKAEDAAHVSGDIGTFILAVRQDTLANSLSADGDYGALKLDSVGALWTRVSQMPTPNAPNTALASVAVSVASTETALPTTALASRKRMIVQNLGNKAIYLGPTGVTTSSGLRIAAGANVEIDLGPGVTLYGITDSGTVATRVFEVA